MPDWLAPFGFLCFLFRIFAALSRCYCSFAALARPSIPHCVGVGSFSLFAHQSTTDATFYREPALSDDVDCISFWVQSLSLHPVPFNHLFPFDRRIFVCWCFQVLFILFLFHLPPLYPSPPRRYEDKRKKLLSNIIPPDFPLLTVCLSF